MRATLRNCIFSGADRRELHAALNREEQRADELVAPDGPSMKLAWRRATWSRSWPSSTWCDAMPTSSTEARGVGLDQGVRELVNNLHGLGQAVLARGRAGRALSEAPRRRASLCPGSSSCAVAASLSKPGARRRGRRAARHCCVIAARRVPDPRSRAGPGQVGAWPRRSASRSPTT